MIRIKTDINEKAQKSLSKDTINFCIVALVIGSIGLLAYIILATIFENNYLDILLLFSIPFGVGLVYIIFINKNIKAMAESKITNEYEFEENYFNVISSKNGEEFGRQKVYYKDIYKVKEKEEYIFIYINKINAYIIDTTNSNEEDLKIIKNLLNLKINRI